MRGRILLVVLVVVFASWSVVQADVLMVTNTDDSGPGSLRQCIADALPGDEIQFDPSLDGQPIVLTSGELSLDHDLVIVGRGADNTILRGNGTSNVLQIAPDTSVGLSGVTVTQPVLPLPAGDGTIGIVNRGTMIVSDSVITGNTWGIWNMVSNGQSGATMTINNCHVSGNDLPGQGQDDGGGIVNWFWSSDVREKATVTINNSTIQQNSGPGIQNSDLGWWYGVSSDGNAILTINHSVISENRSVWGSSGGGIVNHLGKATISHSTISSNSSWYWSGGGIDNRGELVVIHSTIEGNEIGFDGQPPWGPHGGGIYHFSGHAEIRESTISSNSADCGGAIGVGLDPWNDCGDCEEPATLAVSNSTVTQNDTSGCYQCVYPPWGPERCYPRPSGAIHARCCSEVSFENSIVATQSHERDCFGGLLSLGHNLDSDGSCGLDQPSDVTGQDPMLGPLQDNGGPTWTHMPLEGSPVIDRGVCIPQSIPTPEGVQLPPVLTDQRGVRRPIDGDQDGVMLCDIGSVEYRPPPVFTPIGEPGDWDIITPDSE